MVRDKIKQIISFRKSTQAEVAEKCFGVSTSHFGNKIRSYEGGHFYANDLIKLANYLDMEIAFVDKNTQQIIAKLDEYDLIKDEK